jgi:hypothetical protein
MVNGSCFLWRRSKALPASAFKLGVAGNQRPPELPSVIAAGLIALGGVWVINNVDPSSMHLPSFFQTSSIDGPTDRAPVDRR